MSNNSFGSYDSPLEALRLSGHPITSDKYGQLKVVNICKFPQPSKEQITFYALQIMKTGSILYYDKSGREYRNVYDRPSKSFMWVNPPDCDILKI